MIFLLLKELLSVRVKDIPAIMYCEAPVKVLRTIQKVLYRVLILGLTHCHKRGNFELCSLFYRLVFIFTDE